MTMAIEVKDLRKSYGTNEVLKGIDLKVKQGSVFAVLGPNGAGKTTLVQILSTLLRPTRGSVKVLGMEVQREASAIRRKISLTGQFASVDEDLSGKENLMMIARLMGYRRKAARSRADELLQIFGLTDAGDRPVTSYSGGMRRRVDIAAGMIETPDLLFLDEPTTGLDPRSRGQVWEIVRRLVGQGTTVLLTTQYLEEADQLAGRIAVLDHGMVIAEGTPAELKASVGSGSVQVRIDLAEQREAAAAVLGKVFHNELHFGSDPAMLSVRSDDPEHAALALIELKRAGISHSHFSIGQPSLDEVFLALTGRPSTDESASKEKEVIQ
ncbi:ATP-binding cassette domain-containing protein [Paenibacillus sp. 1P07SE]|uniref:ATP-binding cassette domain-containing protein n=1 Tax=Paenibacillus sp. 1P07SE TaxID=3132209 RepID=UPI0039A5D68A